MYIAHTDTVLVSNVSNEHNGRVQRKAPAALNKDRNVSGTNTAVCGTKSGLYYVGAGNNNYSYSYVAADCCDSTDVQ